VGAYVTRGVDRYSSRRPDRFWAARRGDVPSARPSRAEAARKASQTVVRQTLPVWKSAEADKNSANVAATRGRVPRVRLVRRAVLHARLRGEERAVSRSDPRDRPTPASRPDCLPECVICRCRGADRRGSQPELPVDLTVVGHADRKLAKANKHRQTSPQLANSSTRANEWTGSCHDRESGSQVDFARRVNRRLLPSPPARAAADGPHRFQREAPSGRHSGARGGGACFAFQPQANCNTRRRRPASHPAVAPNRQPRHHPRRPR
jgi:hypothetical protein